MTTTHGIARALERATLGGLDTSDCLSKAQWAAGQVGPASAAVCIARLDTMVGEAWSEASNGDMLYAIVRAGRVVTMFWRRSTQPRGCAAFRVDKVFSLVVR